MAKTKQEAEWIKTEVWYKSPFRIVENRPGDFTSHDFYVKNRWTVYRGQKHLHSFPTAEAAKDWCNAEIAK
jgi:hypothetical protein